MPRGDLVKKLLLAHKGRDDESFRSIALQIISEEQRKKNHQLARDLISVLDNGNNNFPRNVAKNSIEALPKNRERDTLLVDIRSSDRRFEDAILSSETESALQRIVAEFYAQEIFASYGLASSKKFLFCGPPGCGKTLSAQIISNELGIPILYTRFDAIVSSYIGETAANLRRIFDYAASGKWVVFFDEFDAIGKGRDDPHEHGELKRVVNSFLQLIDSFESDSLIIAATNHQHILDTAIWRRFDDVILFNKPTVHEIRTLLKVKLQNFPRSGINVNVIASQMKGFSHFDVEQVCHQAIKTALLNGRDQLEMEDIKFSLDRQIQRKKIQEQLKKY